jgi:hypothetical protein
MSKLNTIDIDSLANVTGGAPQPLVEQCLTKFNANAQSIRAGYAKANPKVDVRVMDQLQGSFSDALRGVCRDWAKKGIQPNGKVQS